jgi:hypothetical protein
MKPARAPRLKPAPRSVLALGLAALVSLALTGCETTAEKSARLQRQATRVAPTEKGLSITRENDRVRVVGAIVLRDSERAAAVVTLHNRSSRAQRDVPIAIAVRDAHGRLLFANDAPGLESALVSLPSIAGNATAVWVDDQLPVTGAPASVSAKIGAAPSLAGAPPRLAVGATRLAEDPANGTVASGAVTNRSRTAQQGLVLFAVARRAGRIVAAGRAVVPALPPNASAPFQASLVGDAKGATLRVAAPPASFG